MYIAILFEILYLSSIKYTHKQKDNENSSCHIKLLKHMGKYFWSGLDFYFRYEVRRFEQQVWDIMIEASWKSQGMGT